MKVNSATRTFLFLALVSSTSLIAQIPTPKHVLIAIEENHNYSSIIGSSAAPYINSLVADSNAALFTQSYGLTHPSQPNYIMLFSGSNQGVIDDNLPAGLPFLTANLGASLIDSGRTFAGYSEDLPYVGFNGTTSGAYARKHNPWANWQGAPTNGIPSGANVPLTSFPTNYDSLPTVSFVIPNQNNDMHNGSDPARITTGDTWLQNHLNGYVQWAKTHNSLFILTFDEGTTTGDNRIVTLFVGQMVVYGQYGEVINHYSILRTLEDMYGLPYAGNSTSATPITDCWTVAVGVSNTKFIPGKPLLEQNYPNPFNPVTNITFELPSASNVVLTIWNTLGQRVAVLLNEYKEMGRHRVDFEAKALPSGIYYYQLNTGTWSQTKQLVLLR